MSNVIDDVVEEKAGLLKRIFLSDKKIGDLNGKWAASFKIAIIMVFLSFPTSIGWIAWMTNRSYNHESQLTALNKAVISITTSIDQHEQVANEAQLWQQRVVILEKTVKELPPDDWELKVTTLDDMVQSAHVDMNKFEKNNAEAHTSILVALQRLETKMDVIFPSQHKHKDDD